RGAAFRLAPAGAEPRPRPDLPDPCAGRPAVPQAAGDPRLARAAGAGRAAGGVDGDAQRAARPAAARTCAASSRAARTRAGCRRIPLSPRRRPQPAPAGLPGRAGAAAPARSRQRALERRSLVRAPRRTRRASRRPSRAGLPVTRERAGVPRFPVHPGPTQEPPMTTETPIALAAAPAAAPAAAMPMPMPIAELGERARALREQVGRAFIGQPEVFEQALLALLAAGHVLVEGVPGLGKTLLVRALAAAVGCSFGRIQFTPDLMPADVTGHAVYDPKTESFRIRRGPVFANLLL